MAHDLIRLTRGSCVLVVGFREHRSAFMYFTLGQMYANGAFYLFSGVFLLVRT